MTNKKQINHKSAQPITYSLADKRVVWLPRVDKCISVYPPSDEIIQKINKGETDKKIISSFTESLGYSFEFASQFLLRIKQNLIAFTKNENVEGAEYLVQIKKCPENFNFRHCYRINNSIFLIEFEDTAIQISSLPKDVAFRNIVPDSWISPFEKNAKRFLTWFVNLPCWQITYSDNESMLATVKNIFNDEL